MFSLKFIVLRTIDTVVRWRVAHNGVATARSKVVLAVDLVLATIDGVGAGPNVNMRLAVVIVGG